MTTFVLIVIGVIVLGLFSNLFLAALRGTWWLFWAGFDGILKLFIVVAILATLYLLFVTPFMR